MTREELGKKIEETWIDLDKAKNVVYLGEVREAFLKLFDQWTAELIGRDEELTGVGLTEEQRQAELYRYYGNKLRAEQRKKAGLPEK